LKGPLKGHVDHEWCLSQYHNLNKKENVSIKRNFNIDWKKTLNIKIVEQTHTLGINPAQKRVPVYDSEGRWIDTKPIHIEAPASFDSPLAIITHLKQKVEQQSQIIKELQRKINEGPAVKDPLIEYSRPEGQVTHSDIPNDVSTEIPKDVSTDNSDDYDDSNLYYLSDSDKDKDEPSDPSNDTPPSIAER